jgi:hypothetical protein
MNTQDFKNKVVKSLEKNFSKSGTIESVFLYVTPNNDFKALNMEKLKDSSKEYIALFLKDITDKEKPLYTAYITNTQMTQMTEADMEGYLALGDCYTPEHQSPVIDVISVEINSKTERISMNFKGSDTEASSLHLLNELTMAKPKKIANLI